MSFSTERATIEGLFKTGWSAGALATWPVGYDGHEFTFTNGSVRLTIRSGGAQQMSFGAPGSNIGRHAGAVMVQICTEGGKGSAQSRQAQDVVAGIFRNQVADNVRFGIPYVSGVLEDPPFFIATIAVPFERDEMNA